MAGNANSGPKREKPFRDALMIEIAAAGEDRKALRRIAAALLDKAYEGDMNAIKEIADRTDGKAIQQVDQTVEHINYVAELPPTASDTNTWLKQSLPKPSIQ